VAQALFRATDPKLAGWKTGSRISVGLKWRSAKRQKKIWVSATYSRHI